MDRHPFSRPPLPRRTAATAWAAGALTWLLGALAMAWLDGRVDLANLAMVMVITSALASLWWPVPLSLAASAVAVLAFNWAFVPPRGSLLVDGHQHLLLLLGLVAVNLVIDSLLASLRWRAREAQVQAEHAEQLRRWGDTLRDSHEPLSQAGRLQDMLAELGDGGATLWLWRQRPQAPRIGQPEEPHDDSALLQLGAADAEQAAGLWHVLRQGQVMGPGTGRHQELPHWYLPLRGRDQVLGVALVGGDAVRRDDGGLRRQAQALCDQMGQAIERAHAAQDQAHVREQAQAQAVRNALLAAVSHDYRTPLATILGAAGSLIEQAARLSPEQRLRLAGTIHDQAAQLSRLTDNTLQLARLDAPGVALRLDWESAEEIVGAAMNRARREPGLPLLRCDAVLLAQLLDNLIDNALAYSPPDAPVELLVRRQGPQVVLALRDRGPGVPPAWRDKVFDAFQRGEHGSDRQRRGAGIGLAVCRAIAQAHGGQMRLRARAHGGSAFECWLPLPELVPEAVLAPPPALPEIPDAGTAASLPDAAADDRR